MNYKLFLAWAALALCACSNEMDIEVLKSDPKLVMYCFPNTESDTTIIHLSASVPITKNTLNTYIPRFYGSDARITYRVNGMERPVLYTEERINGVPEKSYYVVGSHHCGDEIRIEASANGYPDIFAETTIPEMPEIKDVKNAEVRHEGTTYEQKQITISDNPQTEDFYAVEMRDINSYDIEWFNFEKEPWEDRMEMDTVTVFYRRKLNTDDEPALNPCSTIDDFFDYDNDFHSDFYIFNDNIMTGSQYTLRLNLLPYGYSDVYRDDYNTKESPIKKVRCFRLYKLAPAYYRFIKSLNDNENSLLGEWGLAPLSPTISNVKGGLGVVGGYSVTEHREVMINGEIEVNQRRLEFDEGAHSFDVKLLNYDRWKRIERLASGGSAGEYFTLLGEASADGMSYTTSWCSVRISDEDPSILHVEVAAAPPATESYRQINLGVVAGESTTTIIIKQYSNDVYYSDHSWLKY